MIRRPLLAALAAGVLVAVLTPAALAAQVVKPPATSPGGGPQRWNVVDGVQKQTVPGYLSKESLQPLPPVAAKSTKGAPRANTKRTRAVVEDAVFTPLNKRSETVKYRYYR
ncbi:MAG: hypothetical protein MUF53_05580 [Gemmatimonadaceae bacterium]|jgi:hypothetical protein|nr:hypothetical protein [Gemmatimonadaceae bacterium]